MAWNSSYNEVQWPLFVMGALACFIRFADTGKRSFWWLQVVLFVLGFGSLETNIVYPAIAAAWVLFCGPQRNRMGLLLSTAPLAAISLFYFLLHVRAAALPAIGVYAVHLDTRMATAAWEYWRWIFLSPEWADYGHSPILGKLILFTAMTSVVLLSLWLIGRKRYEALFFLTWFAVTLAPLLPFSDRHSEYYLVVPMIGLAMLGGWGVSIAWQAGFLWTVLALLPLILWLTGMVPVVHTALAHYVEQSHLSKALIVGVQHLRTAEPSKAILIEGATDDLYGIALLYDPFHALGIDDVYLTPDSDTRVHFFPGDERFVSMVIDQAVALHALARNQALVYSFDNYHLRNITSTYALRSATNTPAPRRVEVGNPLYSYLLGPEWLKLANGTRWMPGSATLQVGSPTGVREELSLSGYCWDEQLRRGPLGISVFAEELLLGRSVLRSPNTDTHFTFSFPLPPTLVGQRLMTVRIVVNPPIRLDGQDYGLIFGSIAVRSP